MSKTITISEHDIDVLRRVRTGAAPGLLGGADVAALDDVLARILASAEQPAPGGPGLDAARRDIDRPGAIAWICPACDGACVRDAMRLVWDCSRCLATFTDETQLGARAMCASPAGSSADPLTSSCDIQPDQSAPATSVTAVALHPLPRGGHVAFTFRDGDRSVYLPGRRFQLVWTLLVPPAPHAAGELIPNADLIEQVWDDDPALGSRRDLNVLIMRCRQDLVAAGISAALIERAPGGCATRIRLGPGAQVTIAAGEDAPPTSAGKARRVRARDNLLACAGVSPRASAVDCQET